MNQSDFLGLEATQAETFTRKGYQYDDSAPRDWPGSSTMQYFSTRGYLWEQSFESVCRIIVSVYADVGLVTGWSPGWPETAQTATWNVYLSANSREKKRVGDRVEPQPHAFEGHH